MVALGVRGTLRLLSDAVGNTAGFTLSCAVPNGLFNLFSSFSSGVEGDIGGTLRPLSRFTNAVRNVQGNLSQLVVRFPALLRGFEPCIRATVFGGDNCCGIRLCGLTSVTVLGRVRVLFSSIICRLKGRGTRTVSTLYRMSGGIGDGVKVLCRRMSHKAVGWWSCWARLVRLNFLLWGSARFLFVWICLGDPVICLRG